MQHMLQQASNVSVKNKNRIALAKAISTNTTYIGYVDTYFPLIIAYLKEYRERQHKDISCFDPNQNK